MRKFLEKKKVGLNKGWFSSSALKVISDEESFPSSSSYKLYYKEEGKKYLKNVTKEESS